MRGFRGAPEHAAILRDRDPNAEDKMNPIAKQEALEEHQIQKAVMLKLGLKNKNKKSLMMISLCLRTNLNFIKISVINGVISSLY